MIDLYIIKYFLTFPLNNLTQPECKEIKQKINWNLDSYD